MANILNTTKKTIIQWKDFQFPLAIKDFSMKEWAKVATYEYAGRNWAEHERVLSHRVFSISWEFIAWIWEKEPKECVKQLRITNDNKPGKFIHTDIWIFTCILSDLTITQNWEGYSNLKEWNTDLTNSFMFSMELLEHTPPNSKTLKEKNDELFPKTPVKPNSDIYSTRLVYKNATELFNAIIAWKILPGVNPVINAEWLRYDFDMRAEAFLAWKNTWFKIGTTDVVTVNTNQKYYIVKPGDSGTRIAKNYSVAFTKLFELNHWVKVRTNPRWDEGVYRKTSRTLFPWDKILIPYWYKEPKKTTQINRIDVPKLPEIPEIIKEDKWAYPRKYLPYDWVY